MAQKQDLILFEKNQNTEGVILFKDNSKIFITKQQMESIYQTENEFFTINGCDYYFKIIDKILYLDEYYQQYPEKRLQEKKFFDFSEDNKNKESGYKSYSSKRYCEKTITDFARIIEERKQKRLPYHNVEELFICAKKRLNKLGFK